MRANIKLTVLLVLLVPLAACEDEGEGPGEDAEVDTPPDTTTDSDDDPGADTVEDGEDDPVEDEIEDPEDDEGGEAVVSLTVTNVGITAYDFTGPPDVVGTEAENQTLTLSTGTRYEIVNLATSGHPFELLTLGSTSGEDVVLLSESGAGSLEEDTGIDWLDDGSGTVRFTLTTGLASALSGYRCSLHVTTMRGAIAIP